jgi:ketosteroid isomerase-like protein
MSQENVEVVLQNVEASNQQDAEAFLATLSPDVEWEDSMFWSEPARIYRGKAEARAWFEQAVVEAWDSFHIEVEEIADAGEDRVFSGGVLTTRGKGSGVETELRGFLVFWIANGKITRRQAILDRAEALEAVGLSE